MKIWVFQTGEPLPIDKGQFRPMRAINLCNKLIQAGHQVNLWSSDFSHQEKQFRGMANLPIELSDNFRIRLIPSWGYKKNIGLERLLDHLLLAVNLKRMLNKETELPDVVFIGYPPIETAYVLSKWLNARKIPILLDIKDQWPIIFVDQLPRIARPFGIFLFWPYFYLARNTMKRASGISSMADGFLKWALDFCGKTKSDNDRVFPLTTPTDQIGDSELRSACQWWDSIGVRNDETKRLCFVGSFSPAFNFVSIKEAAQLALDQGANLQFVLCGDGNVVNKTKDMMSGLPNVVFPGWIDRPKIEALASRSIASIAPYYNTQDFMLSIPNKIIDSLALGLPILSPLKGEVEPLIDGFGVGLMYVDESEAGSDSLYHAIESLVKDKKLQISMSENARNLYNARFSFESVYGALVNHLEHMVADSRAALDV
ncbi:MAG: glycosyltransferase [bacterium]